MLLVIGVLIAGWTLRAAASDYSVTAKVPADPLTEGAVITDPADGFTTASSPITVTGTCPDSSYVKLIRNGVFSGVAGCTVSNDFTITTSLSAGSNSLQAQDYNITDDPGPVTPGITITYNPPASPPAPSSNEESSPSQSSTSSQPLTVASDYHYQAFTTGATVTWDVQIGGGIIPYHLHTDWGDKTSSEQNVPAASTVTLKHTYAQPGYYAVKVYVTDHTPKTILIQLVAFIRQPGAGGVIVPGTSIPGGTTGSSNNPLTIIFGSSDIWLWIAWPTYITVVLMAISFWLGERQMIRVALETRPIEKRKPVRRR